MYMSNLGRSLSSVGKSFLEPFSHRYTVSFFTSTVCLAFSPACCIGGDISKPENRELFTINFLLDVDMELKCYMYKWLVISQWSLVFMYRTHSLKHSVYI